MRLLNKILSLISLRETRNITINITYKSFCEVAKAAEKIEPGDRLTVRGNNGTVIVFEIRRDEN